MLRIYPVCLELVKQTAPLAEVIARHDRDLARQLRRSITSVALNVAEGSGVRGGNRRLRYQTALGSAVESKANLECALAIGYIKQLDQMLLGAFQEVIATLVVVSR